MQDDTTLGLYAAGSVDAAMLVDGLNELFERYGIPIGLLSKLQVIVGSVCTPHRCTHRCTRTPACTNAHAHADMWACALVWACIGSRMHGCARSRYCSGRGRLQELSTEQFRLEFLIDDSGNIQTKQRTSKQTSTTPFTTLKRPKCAADQPSR